MLQHAVVQHGVCDLDEPADVGAVHVVSRFAVALGVIQAHIVNAGHSLQELGIDAERIAAGLERGDSVAVNGVCLTAVELPGDGFVADVSRETLSLTSLGQLKPGSRVNLEVDIVARYLERLVGESGGLSRARLEEYGFVKGH